MPAWVKIVDGGGGGGVREREEDGRYDEKRIGWFPCYSLCGADRGTWAPL
jgi:hypothetical protein